MKKLLAIGSVVATVIAFTATTISVILTSCGGKETGPLNLQYEVVNNGLDVKLTWDQIESASYYTIAVDGKVIDSTADNTVTEYTVTADHAGKVITVTAVDADTSDQIDLGALVVTTSLGSDFGEASSSYKSAVGFNSDGSAVIYSLTESGNYPYFDFWISDGTTGTVDPNEIDICSPNVSYGGTGNFNSEDNWSTEWGTGYVAPTTGYQNIYPGSGGIMGGKSYALWIDPSGNGWDLNDHFVRIDISSVASDGQVQGKVNYQTVGGLLWIPVD